MIAPELHSEQFFIQSRDEIFFTGYEKRREVLDELYQQIERL